MRQTIMSRFFMRVNDWDNKYLLLDYKFAL